MKSHDSAAAGTPARQTNWNAPDASGRTPTQRLNALLSRLTAWDDAPEVTVSQSEELLLDIKQCLDQVVPTLTERAAAAPVSGEGTGTLTRTLKDIIAGILRLDDKGVQALAADVDATLAAKEADLERARSDRDTATAHFLAKDAHLAELTTEREEMLIERGQLGVRHARLVETRDKLESTLADLRRQGAELPHYAFDQQGVIYGPVDPSSDTFVRAEDLDRLLGRPLPDPPKETL